MILQDDRTPETIQVPHVLVMMTDRFLSGWGQADGGPSYAAWPVTPENADRAFNAIAQRSDAKNVRIVRRNYRPPSGPGHCHIYDNWAGQLETDYPA